MAMNENDMRFSRWAERNPNAADEIRKEMASLVAMVNPKLIQGVTIKRIRTLDGTVITEVCVKTRNERRAEK